MQHSNLKPIGTAALSAIHYATNTHVWENISHTLVLKTACGLTYTVHTYTVQIDFPFKQPLHAGTDP